MKTSTLLVIGAGVAVVAYLALRRRAPTSQAGAQLQPRAPTVQEQLVGFGVKLADTAITRYFAEPRPAAGTTAFDPALGMYNF